MAYEVNIHVAADSYLTSDSLEVPHKFVRTMRKVKKGFVVEAISWHSAVPRASAEDVIAAIQSSEKIAAS